LITSARTRRASATPRRPASRVCSSSRQSSSSLESRRSSSCRVMEGSSQEGETASGGPSGGAPERRKRSLSRSSAHLRPGHNLAGYEHLFPGYRGAAPTGQRPRSLRARPSGPHRTKNPSSPAGGSSTTLNPVTTARDGPWRHHSTVWFTAGGEPSNTASTRPSGRLRTQPATPSRVARRRHDSRNHTPWTCPSTQTWRRMIASAATPGR
jgi:hypothetical protein